jgi:hypothetical protein
VVYYANIAFNRVANPTTHSAFASAITVSRSFDKGETWETHYVIQDDDPAVFHDKEWIAVAPDATVYYTRSADGAVTWDKPVKINQEAGRTDQFFQWISVSGDFVHVGFVDRQYTADALLDHSYAVSTTAATPGARPSGSPPPRPARTRVCSAPTAPVSSSVTTPGSSPRAAPPTSCGWTGAPA